MRTLPSLLAVNWSAIEAVGVWAQFAVLASALEFARRQFRQLSLQNRREGLVRVYDHFEQTRELRHWVYNGLPDPTAVSEADLLKLDRLTTTFDRVAHLVQSGSVAKSDVFESHAQMIVTLWDQVEPYVALQREMPGRGFHVVGFEAMASDAEAALDRDRRIEVAVWRRLRRPSR